MNPSAPHAVVLLAAGRSRRLGQPKQLLTQQGETLLHRAARLGHATRPGRMVVVLDSERGPMVDALAHIPHHLAINPDPASGLSSSLRIATPHVQAFADVLVLVCDQPALSAEHLETLLRGARTVSSGCAATALDGLPGVPAVVPGHWFTALSADLHDTGFRARLRQLHPGELFLLHGDRMEQDIDTPAALVRARAAGLVDG